MLHEKPFQHHRPDGMDLGADADSDSDSGDWAGEKRLKHFGPSFNSEVRTSSSASPPAQGCQEDPFFTAADLENFFISLDEIMGIKTFKEKDFIFVDRSLVLDFEAQRHVYKRLVLYRLKAHKLSKGESRVDDVTLEMESPDFLRKETEDIFQLHFEVDKYFKSLEKADGCSVGWYFDPEFSKLKDLAHYQRLVLKNHHHKEYLNWAVYRSNFTTYKMDKDYVMFYTEMSKKLQWLKKYIKIKGSDEWRKKDTLGGHQALKIATRYPGLTVDLAYTAYEEHVWSLHYDYLFCEEWDIIFFEIWKLVTKKELKFTPALMQVKERHLVPRHEKFMLRFLKNSSLLDLKSKFDICVKSIPHDAEEGFAKELIAEELLKLPRQKMLHQYVEKKMSIAEKIGLHEDCSAPRMVSPGGNMSPGRRSESLVCTQ